MGIKVKSNICEYLRTRNKNRNYECNVFNFTYRIISYK
jgi:hypothetical protein